MRQQSLKLVMTRPAVEALLEADPEARATLSQQVAEQIVQKHFLKCVENNPRIQEVSRVLNDEVVRQIGEQIGAVTTDWAGRVRGVVFGAEVTTAVRDEVQRQTKRMTEEVVRDAIDSVVASLRDTIKQQVDEIVPSLVKDRVRQFIRAQEKGDV